jgi:hypothetical protein
MRSLDGHPTAHAVRIRDDYETTALSAKDDGERRAQTIGAHRGGARSTETRAATWKTVRRRASASLGR